MKKLFYFFIILLAVAFVACDNGQPEGPSNPNDPSNPEEPSNPDQPSDPTIGTFVAKPFSVSATKTVTFSPGNLQYHPVNDEWRFAPNQTDYIGEANANISSSYNGWIDLFGWGTGNNPTNASTDDNDYQTFVDWGVNQIGSYAPNTWRTLTDDEWEYIIEKRSNADKLKGVAQVNGVNGLILLPNSWTCPSGVTFKPGFHECFGLDYYAAYQIFSSSEWAKLEDSGAVLLIAAGYREGSTMYKGYYDGVSYWSSTECPSNLAGAVGGYANAVVVDCGVRYLGRFVRLVQD